MSLDWRRSVRERAVAAAVAVLALTALASLAVADNLGDAEFQRLHAELIAPREAWQAVPWKLSMLEAQRQASIERKPVYMLVRSGHPLGCV